MIAMSRTFWRYRAQVYAALNDKEQTFKWLRTAYDGRAIWMSFLAVDPIFDGSGWISASRVWYGASAY
jgi:hypothetical protein